MYMYTPSVNIQSVATDVKKKIPYKSLALTNLLFSSYICFDNDFHYTSEQLFKDFKYSQI